MTITNHCTDMNVLVTGANGQLGNKMRLIAPSRRDKFIFSDIIHASGEDTAILDITDAAAVRTAIQDNDIDVIVNCAAYTAVDKAEDEPEFCATINASAPGVLAAAAMEAGALLIHISTDYVFDGQLHERPYTEKDGCSSSSIYGRTKLDGEKAVTASGCDYVILRTAWLYSEFGKNFLKTMLRLFSSKDRINVVSDQIDTPTYALDLAEAICSIMDDYSTRSPNNPYERNEIYHYSNEGSCSWYDFARKISELSGNTSCEIFPCSSDAYPSKAVRPMYSVLDKTKFKTAFGISIPLWSDSLKKCIGNL